MCQQYQKAKRGIEAALPMDQCSKTPLLKQYGVGAFVEYLESKTLPTNKGNVSCTDAHSHMPPFD